MSDPNQRLEALRALLYDEPSERAWAKACLALDAWPQDEGLSVGLDYACGLLAAQREAWREVVDFVPGVWAGRRAASLDEPRWAVVEALGLGRWSSVLIAPSQGELGWSLDDARRQALWEAHPVALTRPFLLYAEPVSRALWRWVRDPEMRDLWMYERGRARGVTTEDDLPETGHPWPAALDFCNRLSSWWELPPAYQFGLDDERGAVAWRGLDHEGWRLPTEAEWELACRAGWGEPASWAYPGPVRGDLFPAAEAPPNRLGLFGMKGLALEWVWDAPSPEPLGAVDPTGPLVVSASRPMPRRDRILKGALFSAAPDSPQWHPAWRSSMLEATVYEGIAFRCARSLRLE